MVKFAAERNLVLMADEVYQTNIFEGEFHSFKRALRTLQQKEPGKYDTVELASLHSVSKGMVGECGHRSGYFELVGFDPEVQAQIFKFIVGFISGSRSVTNNQSRVSNSVQVLPDNVSWR